MGLICSNVTYPLGLPVSLSVITRALTQSGKALLNESLSVSYERPMQISVFDGVLFPRPRKPPPRPPRPPPLGEALDSALSILTALPSISDPLSPSAFCPSSGLPKSTYPNLECKKNITLNLWILQFHFPLYVQSKVWTPYYCMKMV